MEYEAFVDESGQSALDARTDRYYAVSAVIVPVMNVVSYEHELRGLKRAHFRCTDVEIKSNWVRNPDERVRHYLRPFQITEKRLTSFVDAMYEWMLGADVTLIGCIVDKQQHTSQYVAPHDPRVVAHQMFVQRYELHLRSRNATGRITCDELPSMASSGITEQELLRRTHVNAIQSGCPYTDLKYSRTDPGIRFANSASSSLLQLTDLAAYNCHRQFRDHGQEWDDPSTTRLPVYGHFARMVPKLRTNSQGIWSGYGIAKHPTRRRAQWSCRTIVM